ncbi:MAG: hypothetical protein AB8H86_08340 [Polyangiales bacterium]
MNPLLRSLGVISVLVAFVFFVYLFGREALVTELLLLVYGIPVVAWTEWRAAQTQTKTLSFSNDHWRRIEGIAKKEAPQEL